MHRYKKRRTLALACAMSLPLILGGCASLTSLSAALMGKPAETLDVVAVACGSFGPIAWADGDTDETLAQIHEHNAAWRALCARAPQPQP